LETASSFDAALRDVFEGLNAASRQLGRLEDVPAIASAAVDLAIRLTKSSGAFIAFDAAGDGFERFYSYSAETGQKMATETLQRLVQAARANDTSLRYAVIGYDLQPRGEPVGLIGVTRPSNYSELERQAFGMFAYRVAEALETAGLRQRQHALDDAVVNLRAELDRTEAERVLAAEKIQSAERVERAHELAVQVLLSVSAHARSGHNLTDFYRRLATTVAELVGAAKVVFWRLGDDQMLWPLPGGFGVDEELLRRLKPTPCKPGGDDLASQVVFDDMIFRASMGEEPATYRYVLETLGVSNAISVPWRAGDQRLGLVAAYESTRPAGFSREDTWVLQKAGLAAGLVTQLWHAQEDLKRTVEQLRKVDAARQLLLKNITSAVEKERRRLASELHDDALQKLTAAELHLGRAEQAGADVPGVRDARNLLDQAETSLRRLLFEVHPPALEHPNGLAESIRDRVEILRSSAGIDVEVNVELPDDLPLESKSLIFRQIAEAVNNVERHARAKRASVSVGMRDGGAYGLVADDGQGFVVSERGNLPGHLGLLTLRERALMAGGWYKIESEPGAGTRIEFWIPVAN